VNPSARQVEQNIAEVQARIERAAARGGRDSADVTLVAVTKTHGVDTVVAAFEAGMRHFGENRVEEAESKIPAAREVLPAGATWHMIGHIQSRKTRDAAPLFDWFHSIDRYKIARRLDLAASDLNRTLPGLIEVNVSGEESKYGFDLSAWPEDVDQGERFFEQVGRMLELPALDLQGLMTMAPYTEEPDTVRPIFRRLRELRETLRERFPERDWPHLSMGMSADYEVAVEEGATIVRIGTALFGPREV
jgi:pyridoxal phosphate enzyme (YggS family)